MSLEPVPAAVPQRTGTSPTRGRERRRASHFAEVYAAHNIPTYFARRKNSYAVDQRSAVAQVTAGVPI